jgi:hypothetical protein
MSSAPQTAVHVLMPDASAGSRTIWGGSECLQVGPDVTAKRREALESTTFAYLPTSSEEEDDCFGFLPLLSGGGSLGVLGKVWVDPGHSDAIFQMLLPVEGKELQRFAS